MLTVRLPFRGTFLSPMGGQHSSGTIAMASTSKADSLDEALEIVVREYGASDGEPYAPIPDVKRVGELFVFTENEWIQLKAVGDLISGYVNQPHPRRPLSLAVFGPPGSGKSFAVKQILKSIEEAKSDLKLWRTDVNLTQLPDAHALAKVVARAGTLVDGTVPIFFFDEFDAPKDGAPFGWLAWFLAPMQDGEFVYDGEVIRLRRAVYVFAGGTAGTLEQFADFDRLPEFQRAKGPDFISRLRGFIDVCGPNAEPRMLRRAILFHSEFTSRARQPGGGPFSPDSELMRALLQVGRYRHGARSIAAVVELSHIDPQSQRLEWSGLPKGHLLAMHIDRGPPEPKVLGGAITLSGQIDS